MPRFRNCLRLAAVALVLAASSRAYGATPRVFQLSQLPQSNYSGRATPSSYGMRGEFMPEQPAANPSYSQGIQTPTPPGAIYNPQLSPASNCIGNYVPPPPVSIVALAESTFFWPSINGVSVSNGIGAAGPAGAITNIDPNSNPLFLVAPRIALGVQGCRWGIVGRFWDAQTTSTNAIDVEPNGVNAINTFHAYTADLEVVRRFAGQYGSIWAFGGFRYGSIMYQESFAAGTFTNTDFVHSAAFGNSRFNGSGFTFGAYGTHAIGSSPFSLFASNRYSFLFGQGRSFTQAEASVLAPGGSDAAADCNCGSDVAQLFIAEVQLGAQWEHQLRWMPARAFIRTAAEYQYWTTAGIANRSITQTAFVGNTVGTGTATASNLLLNMVGFTIGAGIIY